MTLYAKLGAVLALILAFAGWSVWMEHLGAAGPKAELAQYKAQVADAKKLADAQQAQIAAQTKTLIAKKDADNEKALLAVSNAWSSEYQRLRDDRNRLAGQAQKPTRIVAGVCDGADANQRLSDAISKYRDSVRSTVGLEREGVARLLEVCQRQTANWDNLKASVAGVKNLNSANP